MELDDGHGGVVSVDRPVGAAKPTRRVRTLDQYRLGIDPTRAAPAVAEKAIASTPI